MNCSVEDCEREARNGGMCWTHRKRQQRGRSLLAPIRQYDPRETLERAGRDLADADTSEEADAEFERRRKRLAMAALRFALRKRRPQCPRTR